MKFSFDRYCYDLWRSGMYQRPYYSGYRRPVQKTWWNTPMKPHKAAYFFLSLITFGMLPLMVLAGKAVCKLLIAVICSIGKDSE